MSASVQLLLAPGEKDRISHWLNEMGVNEGKPYHHKGMFIVPEDGQGQSGFVIHWSDYALYGGEDERPEWDGYDILELEYKIWDGAVGGQFATAIAQEIILRHNVLAAGWDSIGFCKTLKEFKECRPFRAEIAMTRRCADKVTAELKSEYEKVAAEYERCQPIFEAKAREALDGSKEFVYSFPEEEPTALL